VRAAHEEGENQADDSVSQANGSACRNDNEANAGGGSGKGLTGEAGVAWASGRGIESEFKQSIVQLSKGEAESEGAGPGNKRATDA
jgi:hypothetical protein